MACDQCPLRVRRSTSDDARNTACRTRSEWDQCHGIRDCRLALSGRLDHSSARSDRTGNIRFTDFVPLPPPTAEIEARNHERGESLCVCCQMWAAVEQPTLPSRLLRDGPDLRFGVAMFDRRPLSDSSRQCLADGYVASRHGRNVIRLGPAQR